MLKKIMLNNQEVTYDLQRKNVKNINLRIKADQSVYLSASKRVSQRTIESFLISKSDFILNALSRFKQLEKQAPKPKQYTDGEHLSYLGDNRVLKVFQGNRNQVEIDNAYITLTVKDITDTELKRRTFEKWSKQQCREVITGICKSVFPKFEKYGIPYPEIRFRKMTSQWGNCYPTKGVLTFNTALIETPIPCVEYVVTHEFTHFLQPNHSKLFYQQLLQFMPDWKERKKLLEKYILHKGENI